MLPQNVVIMNWTYKIGSLFLNSTKIGDLTGISVSACPFWYLQQHFIVITIPRQCEIDIHWYSILIYILQSFFENKLLAYFVDKKKLRKIMASAMKP